jgi:hypothetical protein
MCAAPFLSHPGRLINLQSERPEQLVRKAQVALAQRVERAALLILETPRQEVRRVHRFWPLVVRAAPQIIQREPEAQIIIFHRAEQLQTVEMFRVPVRHTTTLEQVAERALARQKGVVLVATVPGLLVIQALVLVVLL